MNKKLLKRSLSLLGVLSVIAIIWPFVQAMRDTRICRFHFSHDRSILIRCITFMVELEYPIDYEVYKGPKLLFPKRSCSGIRLPLDATAADFRAFEFQDDKIVVQQRSDDSNATWHTIVVHDFRTGKSFPRNASIKEFRIDMANAKPIAPEDLMK